MTTPFCTCSQYAPYEHLQLWQVRASRVADRMMKHGRAFNTVEMDKTIALILVMEKQTPECFAPENRHRSHHLADCPAAARNQGPRMTVDQLCAAACRIFQRERDAMTRWAQTRPELNSLFTADLAGSALPTD